MTAPLCLLTRPLAQSVAFAAELPGVDCLIAPILRIEALPFDAAQLEKMRVPFTLLWHKRNSHNPKIVWLKDTIKALYPAQEQLQREINPVIYTAAEFSRRVSAGESFVSNLLANPKLFVIGTENDLGKLAGHPPAAGV